MVYKYVKTLLGHGAYNSYISLVSALVIMLGCCEAVSRGIGHLHISSLGVLGRLKCDVHRWQHQAPALITNFQSLASLRLSVSALIIIHPKYPDHLRYFLIFFVMRGEYTENF